MYKMLMPLLKREKVTKATAKVRIRIFYLSLYIEVVPFCRKGEIGDVFEVLIAY